MKKLMIAAAIVCAAAMSQAATISWTLTNVYDEKGTTLVGNTYKAYLFTTTKAAIDSWADISSSEALTAALKDGYAFTWAAAGKYSDTSTKPTLDVVNAASQLGLVGGNEYTFYTVVVNSAADAYYISSTQTKTLSAGTDNTLLAFGSQATATQGKTDAWQSVPEPTSGLLLLLGVAGLALRRRRA